MNYQKTYDTNNMPKTFTLYPSILSADFAHLAKDVTDVLNAGADGLHIDIMDNHFVPNLSFGPMICHALQNANISTFYDVHIMAKPVDSLVDMSLDAKANQISIHPNTSLSLKKALEKIKSRHCLTGIAINPDVDLNVILPIASLVDTILIMLVKPGFGGQTPDYSLVEKIKDANQRFPDKIIQVDGGVSLDNIEKLVLAGATSFVAGSAIFGKDDYQSTIESFRNAIR